MNKIEKKIFNIYTRNLSTRPVARKICWAVFLKKKWFLIVQYSLGAVEEFIIVWCILTAHIHEGLYWYIFLKSEFHSQVLAYYTAVFMQIIL